MFSIYNISTGMSNVKHCVIGKRHLTTRRSQQLYFLRTVIYFRRRRRSNHVTGNRLNPEANSSMFIYVDQLMLKRGQNTAEK